MGAPNHCRGRRKAPTVLSQVLSSIQYICFRKTSGSNIGRQTCFLPWAPSNVVTPLASFYDASELIKVLCDVTKHIFRPFQHVPQHFVHWANNTSSNENIAKHTPKNGDTSHNDRNNTFSEFICTRLYK